RALLGSLLEFVDGGFVKMQLQVRSAQVGMRFGTVLLRRGRGAKHLQRAQVVFRFDECFSPLHIVFGLRTRLQQHVGYSGKKDKDHEPCRGGSDPKKATSHRTTLYMRRIELSPPLEEGKSHFLVYN